jgi:hypothetical protein
MNWRSPRFLIPLLIVCIVLVISAGIWIYLVNRSQNRQSNRSQSSQNQWVHLPPSVTPTIPANGYLFKDPAGRFVVYHVPATPSATIIWMTYRNQQDGYAIDYPSNWTQIQNPSNGHTGMAFYPPGTNLNENVPGGPKGIGFRWIETSQTPVPTDPTITNIKPITINGITGQLYTQGSLGAAIIVTFPYKGGSFILTTDADSDVLIYAFQHMLESLKFI